MKKLLPFALLALAACVDGGGEPVATPLRLATWNLEHLAERDGEGCRPRQEADYAELRRHAEAIGADVVAFQEVESRRAAERVFPADRWSVVIEERADNGGGGCYGSPGRSIRAQRVGFAIRKPLGFTRHPDVHELGLGRDGLRWGVDVTLATPRPLRLLSVHLKSGCNSGRAATDRDCDVLFAQLPVLERWIDARAVESAAFAVMGDWNRRLAARADAFWTDIDDAEPSAADLTLASGQRGATCKTRYKEFIDFIALDLRAAARMVDGSFSEYRYDAPEARHPSDHCPVSVAVASR